LEGEKSVLEKFFQKEQHIHIGGKNFWYVVMTLKRYKIKFIKSQKTKDKQSGICFA
jgi:chemotaxis receptor (MCP) glutamine deamidase CheD